MRIKFKTYTWAQHIHLTAVFRQMLICEHGQPMVVAFVCGYVLHLSLAQTGGRDGTCQFPKTVRNGIALVSQIELGKHSTGNTSVQSCLYEWGLTIYKTMHKPNRSSRFHTVAPYVLHCHRPKSLFTPFRKNHCFRLLIPTFNPSGFRKNPSRVSRTSWYSSNSKSRKTVETINASSISATFRPTHERGP